MTTNGNNTAGATRTRKLRPARKPGFPRLCGLSIFRNFTATLAALAILLAAHTRAAAAPQIITVAEQNGKLFIAAGAVTARVDLSSGAFDLFRTGSDIFMSAAYTSATFSISSTSPGPAAATTTATLRGSEPITWFMQDTGGPDGPGARVTVSRKSAAAGFELRTIFSYSENKPGIFIESRIKNVSAASTLLVERLTPAATDAPHSGVFLGLDPSGTKLLTSYFFCRDDQNVSPAPPNGFSACSDNAAAYYDEKSTRGLAAGFITSRGAVNTVTAGFDPANPSREPDSDRLGFSFFRASGAYNPPVALAPGRYLESETLVILPSWGPPSKELEIYAQLAAATSGAKPPRPPVILSFSTPDMTPESALSALDATLARLAPAKPGIFKIGPGWETNPSFSGLMKTTADQIRKRNLTPGITVAPFTTRILQTDGKQYSAQPGQYSSEQRPAPLDLSKPESQNAIYNAIRRASQEWGFSYIEIDMEGFTPPAELFLNRPATRQAALAKFMDLIRNAAGASATIATTGSDPTELLPGVDIAGVGFKPDSTPTSSSAPEEVYSFLNMARMYYLNGRARLNNPGPLRTTGGPGNPATPAAQAAMYAGALEIAIPPGGAPADYCESIKPFIPLYTRGAAPADLFDRGITNGFLSQTPASVLNLRIATQWEKWNVVGIFTPANQSAAATKTITFENLGLAPNARYYVYDFQTAAPLGAYTGKFDAAATPGGMRILGVRAASNAPQLLSSNRSYTMGAVEISSMTWDAASSTLSGTLDSSPAFNHTLTFAVPAPYTFAEAAAPGAEASTETSPPAADIPATLRLKIRSPQGGPVQWKIKFSKK